MTTVGYGDIVPQGTTGRLAGVLIMITGIAVLGALAGSLSALFHLEDTSGDTPAKQPTMPEGGPSIQHELAALQAQLRTVERRLGELASLPRSAPGEPD